MTTESFAVFRGGVLDRGSQAAEYGSLDVGGVFGRSNERESVVIFISFSISSSRPDLMKAR